ncbi:MAG: hypothetical protein ACKVQS_14435, partial [Fimbriimonadaceae bacterium]
MKTGAKIFWWATGGIIAVGGGTLGVFYGTYDAEILPSTYILDGNALIGNKEAVKKSVDQWYENYSMETVELTGKGYGEKKFGTSLKEMGCELDTAKTASEFKYKDFFTNLIGGYSEYKGKETEVEPVIECKLTKIEDLKAFVEKYKPEIGDAKAKYVGGKILLTYENVSNELDESKVESALLAAAYDRKIGAIPFVEAPKHVPDAELEKITTVVSEFKTSFNAGKVSRSANIRLAASRINGLILMPGESFSFN